MRICSKHYIFQRRLAGIKARVVHNTPDNRYSLSLLSVCNFVLRLLPLILDSISHPRISLLNTCCSAAAVRGAVIGGGGAGRALNSGSWDAIHVLEVTPAEASPAAGGAAGIPTAAPTKWLYKLTSTLIFNLHVAHACSASSSTSSAPSGDRGAMQLSGCLSRQTSLTAALTLGKGHVAHIGGLVETMESELRTSLDQLYISKTREAVAALHSGGSHDGSPASAGQHARSGIAGGVALPGLGSALQHHSSSTSSGASGGSAHPAELVGDLRAALASRTAT